MLPSPRRLRRRERARRRRFVVGALITFALIAGSLVQLSRLPPIVTEAHTDEQPTELVAIRTDSTATPRAALVRTSSKNAATA